jgi:hypothetical protein
MRDFNVVTNFIFGVVGYFFNKSCQQGAATTVYCAVSKDLNKIGGKYFEDCNEGVPIEFAKNSENMKKLFDLSEKITKLSYDDILNEKKE